MPTKTSPPIQSRYPHLRTARPAGTRTQLGRGRIDWLDVSSVLLQRLERLAAATGKTITIFSGYRTSAYSARVGGFAGDPHSQGRAVDATVGGKPIGQVYTPGYLRAYGIESGNVPNFYHGHPDPSHVQVGSVGNVAKGTDTAKGLPPGTQTRFALDIARATGFDPKVIFAWAGKEGAYTTDGTGHFNFLNIRGRGSAGMSPGGFAEYGNLQEAERASAYWIKRLIGRAGPTPAAQITQIQQSRWDSGHEAGLQNVYARLFGTRGADQPQQNASDVGPGKGLGIETAIGLGGLGIAAYPAEAGAAAAASMAAGRKGLSSLLSSGAGRTGVAVFLAWLVAKFGGDWAKRAAQLILGFATVIIGLMILGRTAATGARV